MYRYNHFTLEIYINVIFLFFTLHTFMYWKSIAFERNSMAGMTEEAVALVIIHGCENKLSEKYCYCTIDPIYLYS